MKNFPIHVSALLSAILFCSCTGYDTILSSYKSKEYHGVKYKHPNIKWYKMNVFTEAHEPNKPFEILAEVSIVGGKASERGGLLNKLKREAGYYHADALYIQSERTTSRSYSDGVGASFALLSIVTTAGDDCCCDDDVPVVRGSFRAKKIRAWAIRYLE